VLLLNPTSGKGRSSAAAPLAVARLQDRGLEVVQVVGHDAADASLRLRAAVDAAPTAAVVACGGDGTVHLCLQAVAGTGVALGFVPSGTGNDSATLLGVPREPQAAADLVAEMLLHGEPFVADVGHVVAADGADRYFLGVMSSGFDSMVNERANRMTWPSGQARYLRAILAELRVFRAVPYTVVLDEERDTEQRVERRGMLVAVGNGTQYGGGMKVCPGARLDDGLLALTFLDEMSTATFLRVFPTVYKGTHVQRPEVHEHVATTVRLDAPRQVAYADGERVGPLPVEVSVRPRAVRLLVPAPAAAAT
jgi:diacylglycerol kinase (ATP)